MAALPLVAQGDAHVQAHNDERAAINALKNLSDTSFVSALNATYGKPATIAGLPDTNLVCFHRGVGVNRQIAPQQSYEGYDLAIAHGAHIIDADHRVTADGIGILMHDTTSDLTTGIAGTIAAMPFHLLPQIYQPGVVGSGWSPTPIPAVEGFLRRYAGRVVVTIEAKSSAYLASLIATIKALKVEKSTLINYMSTAPDASTVYAQINAAGIGVHAYGVNSTALVDMIVAAGGAAVVEVSLTAPSSLVTYAKNAGIYRVMASLVNIRADLTSLPAGVNGFVTDSPGYTTRSSGNYRQVDSISRSIATGKVGIGWKLRTKGVNNWLIARQNTDGTTNPNGGLWLQNALGNQQQVSPGDMCGAIGPTGTLQMDLMYPALGTDLTRAGRMRVLATTEDGTGQDTDTNGYIFELRQNGNIRLLTSNAVLGNGAAVLGKIPTGAPCVAGTIYSLTFEWTATQVRGIREDTFVTLSSAVPAGTTTSLPVNSLPYAVAAGDKLVLPDGTEVTVATGGAAQNAVSIPINSQTLPAVSSGAALRQGTGWVANTDWRGMFHYLATSMSSATGGTCVVTDFRISTVAP